MENYKAFEYFASANGYTGFRSYFDTVYRSKDFEKIIILHGGPGSGKSTIIRKAESIAMKHGLYREILRCSSDTNSLDGAIIEYDNKRVAILDGTAPHIRGEELPGAVDEIFDTGSFFDFGMLKKEREKIYELNELKSAEYSRAYSELANSYIFDINIKAEINNYFDSKIANEILDSILNDCDNEFSKQKLNFRIAPHSTRIISSFSKNGDEILDTPMLYGMRTVSVFGSFGEELILINYLADHLKNEGFRLTEFPTALDGKYLDCIMCEELSLCITTLKNSPYKINADKCLRIGFDSVIPKIERSITLRDEFKNKAAAHLRAAADYHATLEKIYTPCVDFTSMEKHTENIYEKLFTSLNI